MIGKRIEIDAVGGVKIPMDTYIPEVTDAIDINIMRPSVVICPGGGYTHLAKREAEPIALAFAAAGFNAFVIWYRISPNRYPIPQQDAASAVAYVRAHAKELHSHPDHIAIMGFSAGGHLAGSLGTRWQCEELWEPMGLAPQQVRPNAMVLCYPVISGGEYAHRGSFEALTGVKDENTHQAYSVDQWVSESCPPTFLWHTFEDGAVPVQNSLLMATALAKHGVLTQMHIFPYGGHGAALCNEQTSGVHGAHHINPHNAAWAGMAQAFLKQIFA